MNKIVVRFLLVCALIVGGYTLRIGQVTGAGSTGAQASTQPREDLRRFMQSKVHQEYTFLSYTIWHDRPLTPAKMDSIAASSVKIIGLSNELTAYVALYKEQGWSNEDVKLFEEKRLQLSRVAQELNRAAQKRDAREVHNFFTHLDNTCQSCHKRFRPDLQWL
jgi:cytochrome c556